MTLHANHAGTSWPKPAPVVAAVRAALELPIEQHGACYAAAHGAIAAALDLPAPERLLLTSSCTQALALALGDLPWQAGDTVVTSSLEHHALARPVQKLVHERGVQHVAVPYRPGTPFDLDALAAALRRGRVRLVACTGASNVTGELLPLAEITALAHAHGALVLLDAAQLAGTVPLSVRALGVDLAVFAGHKGLQGPLGIGGFWAAPSVAFACPAAVCELHRDGGAAAPFATYPGFCDVGSVNLPAAHGLAAGCAWLAAAPAAVRERPRVLARQLRAALRDRPGCRVLGGDGPHTGTVAVVLDALPLARAEAHFAAHGITVRAGSHCAPMALAALGTPQGVLRLSFGPGNAATDADAVLAAIDAARA
ncbi:MAG: aminotransferase class V-fold PLP-dependent enzyme [Planctomycetes bacterium]|nr:aminotransferase class V-fold PLP-dependent enzyme [Planctomycetota bacterium]